MASRNTVATCTRLAFSRIPIRARSCASPIVGTQQSLSRYGPGTAISHRAYSASNSRTAKKYSQDHEWVELDTDGTTGTIGISTYAAKALGEVVYVELPAIDTDVSKGDAIGAVESVKSASDILTPVSGKILETNSTLEGSPGNINKNPEGESWIAKIKVKDTTELDGLMDKEAYAKFTEE